MGIKIGGDSVTSKFPDGNFSRPQLAIFAFASQNKNKAVLFESHTRHKQLCRSYPQFFTAFQTADGVRFELTIPLGMLVFKTSALDHSATHPIYSVQNQRLSRSRTTIAKMLKLAIVSRQGALFLVRYTHATFRN